MVQICKSVINSADFMLFLCRWSRYSGCGGLGWFNGYYANDEQSVMDMHDHLDPD